MALNMRILKTAWLRILCAIVLICVGFAHQPVFTAASTDFQEFSQYVLPDGSIPVICISDWEGGDNSHPDVKYPERNCEACRLSAGAILPAPATLNNEAATQKALRFLPYDDAIFSEPLTHGAAPRAPPALLALL